MRARKSYKAHSAHSHYFSGKTYADGLVYFFTTTFYYINCLLPFKTKTLLLLCDAREIDGEGWWRYRRTRYLSSVMSHMVFFFEIASSKIIFLRPSFSLPSFSEWIQINEVQCEEQNKKTNVEKNTIFSGFFYPFTRRLSANGLSLGRCVRERKRERVKVVDRLELITNRT